ncbi:hypothetical protein AMAG_14728 [Allomyces macrogynus ATCC 38327]|uniref:Rab-GAP TBC domain-containing protein n=1 Tax=Allomyces macrogynus (strain ATCC 38327) TaxID=578462 RepID=A0A0L0T594_ALLM3|nr:hypothetical protein AMAG_14728 [Allomyces macrogynus ATCC 38327]|eukprot:KNE69881.1 hypothetical protein AMAG_14728 [Allomyces macrogynus ATCC 38327]
MVSDDDDGHPIQRLHAREPTTLDEIELHDAIARREIAKLRAIGATRGFLTRALRRQVWPILLRVDGGEPVPLVAPLDPNDRAKTDYEEQIDKDVRRSFVLFAEDIRTPHAAPSTTNEFGHREDGEDDDIFETVKARKRAELQRMLVQVVGHHPARVVSLYYLRDAMHESLHPVMAQMRILLPILRNENPDVFELFQEVELEPHFCLSWITTWFAHDIDRFDDVCRLFDFFLSTNPIMPLYVSAVIVLSQADELLQQDRDFAMVHSFLSKMPKYDSIETWIAHALRLFNKYPIPGIQGITGWAFDDNCAALRFAHDFPGSLRHSYLPIDQIPALMQTTVASLDGTGGAQPFGFRPLPLVKRVGRGYVPVDGDGQTLLLLTALALGILSVSLGLMQQGGGGHEFVQATGAVAKVGVPVMHPEGVAVVRHLVMQALANL